jgi:hypothetical protein
MGLRLALRAAGVGVAFAASTLAPTVAEETPKRSSAC